MDREDGARGSAARPGSTSMRLEGEVEPSRARAPVTTLAELDTLDEDEMVEGYLDGFKGEPAPGDNRSKAYWHGWRNGESDRNHTSDEAQLKLSRAIGERRRAAIARAERGDPPSCGDGDRPAEPRSGEQSS